MERNEQGLTERQRYWLEHIKAVTHPQDLIHAFLTMSWRIERDYQRLKQELGVNPT